MVAFILGIEYLMLNVYLLLLLFNVFGSCLIFLVLHVFLKALSNMSSLLKIGQEPQMFNKSSK